MLLITYFLKQTSIDKTANMSPATINRPAIIYVVFVCFSLRLTFFPLPLSLFPPRMFTAPHPPPNGQRRRRRSRRSDLRRHPPAHHAIPQTLREHRRTVRAYPSHLA